MEAIKKDSSLADKTTGTTSNSMSDYSMSSNLYQGNSRSMAELDSVHEVLEWTRNSLPNPTDSLSDGYSLRALSDLVAKKFRDLVEQINMPTDRGGRNLGWVKPNGLSPIQAAEIIFAYEHIRMVCPVETIDKPKSNGVLAFYVRQGKNEGIYQEIGDGQIDKWCVALGGAVKLNWKKEFHKKLSDLASREGFRVCECEDKSLVFMKNGILNYETKELLEFSPELIALRKSDTYLPMTLPAVPIHTKPDGTNISFWELLKSFAPYEGGVDLLVKTAGAALRNRHNWRGMVTLFNSTGRNGKSTYLDHLKALVGNSGSMTSNLATLAGSSDAGRFGVSNIVGASLITCEDSDSGAYIKDNSRLKSIISHDTISVERKGEPMFDYRPNTLIVCAANDIPKTKDKGSAWLDRNIYVPFTGQFVGGDDDISIRSEWVVSEEFCSFMAYQALIAFDNYYELPEPREAIELKKEWVRENDSVMEFWDEVIEN
jgi:putative DNA primase/helicase